jgi:hypothetical protein
LFVFTDWNFQLSLSAMGKPSTQFIPRPEAFTKGGTFSQELKMLPQLDPKHREDTQKKIPEPELRLSAVRTEQMTRRPPSTQNGKPYPPACNPPRSINHSSN